MHALRYISLLVLLASGSVSCSSPHTHDLPHAEPEAAATDPFDAAAMAKYMALAMPGPEHDVLAQYVGEWQGTVSMTMGPGAPPMTRSSPATCRMILDGRYLEMRSAGEIMGHPYDSLTMLGFDRRNADWTLVGFDPVGTYWVTGVGKQDDQGVIRMHGRDDSPMGPQVYFFELQFVSADEFVSAVYFTQIGPETYDEPFNMVEARYTRR